MLNKVILMGRLCADPDFRQTQSGVAVCRIRVAVDRRFSNKPANGKLISLVLPAGDSKRSLSAVISTRAV